jgi:transposase-like protein
MDGMNLSKLAKYYSDEDSARLFLEEMRWGKDCKNVACPHCGGDAPYRLKHREGTSARKGLWKCRTCRKQFTVTVGTVFGSSHIPLSKWLLAIHLLASSKKGISAHQLHRNLGITYEAAWFMAHRLRYAMSDGPMANLLTGTVEVDETYIGAKNKKGTKGGRPGAGSHKAPVVALVERGGNVKAMPMARVTADNLRMAITENVDIENSVLMTDEAPMYTKIGREFMWHGVVNHASKEYVRGPAHTNTVEGFFSLLKRGITGVYHHVGKGHLNRYCDEFSFRYNLRHVSDGDRANAVVKGADGKRLTYKQPAITG